jgi:hypothetical protein
MDESVRIKEGEGGISKVETPFFETSFAFIPFKVPAQV